MAEITVVEVNSKKLLDKFIDVPYRVQGKNPVWVPPLRVQQKEKLSPKHPFYEHAKVKNFIALDGQKPVGRIMAINDSLANEYHDPICRFGFFECIDDLKVASALFQKVEECAREWGFPSIMGPFNPSINEDVGFMIDAFDRPNMVMMPYNPPYYPELVEKLGFLKVKDLWAYRIDQTNFSEKTKRGGEIIRKRTKLNYRKMTKQTLMDDAMKIWKIYQKAWEKNWQAVPITEHEFKHLVDELKQIADFDMINLAETKEGEMVGFSLALPDVNHALIHIRDGRLFPFGLPKLLWHTRKGAIDCVRVIIMGVLEEYRGRGVDAVFHQDNFITGVEKGYQWAELGWVLEDNTMMTRVADLVGSEKYKTYRMYEKKLS